MAVVTQPTPIRVETGHGDVRTLQQGRTWAQFKHLQQGFENTRGLRLFFYQGEIEILMPGEVHELFKSIIGFLIETFLFHRVIEFKPTGSMTQEKEGIAAAEADESYEIAGLKLAIEVNFTSRDDSKLDRYQALGVHEVWLWENGTLKVYQFPSGRPTQVQRSSMPGLADLDLSVLSACILMGETSRIQAAQTLLQAHPL